MTAKRVNDPSLEERRDRLRLARTERVGPVTFQYLMARYGSAARAIKALPDLARRARRVSPQNIPSIELAERELAAGDAAGARLIVLGEAAFPPMLAALDPPPPVIWVKGQAELMLRPCIAIVGARIASANGQRFARTLAAELGRAGYVIVSGLARGIDGAAHEAALTTGTVAVLGGGVDDVYPAEHAGLYGAIAERGCVLSESPMGHRAQARDFPRRNRLISGLAQGVVVVEAELRSGSLITARLAAEQGREVFAVPGSPLDPRAKGTNDLIRQGAALCEGAEDVLRVVRSLRFGNELSGSPFGGDLFEGAAFDGPDEAVDALVGKVEALLSPTPVPRDELVRMLGAPAPAVFAALVELALAGRADLLAGGMVARRFDDRA